MRLTGVWAIDPTDASAVDAYGSVRLEFTDHYELIYTIRGEDKDHIILLTFRIEGDEIVTNQPSRPCEERTSFELTSSGALLLSFDGRKTRWLRAEALR